MSTAIYDSIETKKQTGIIVPPQEIRNLADTTAWYVAKNGTSFEIMVMEKEVQNPKFCFLKKDDPYRAYYENKISEYAKGIIDEPKLSQQFGADVKEQDENKQTDSGIGSNQTYNKIEVLNPFQDKDSLLKKNKKELKAPEPDVFTVETPKNLSQLDIDIIKQTAQFVAKNGKKFIVALTEREKNNQQFDFLKPTHELFLYFMALVESYSKCLQITKAQIDKIAKNFKDKMSILNACGERFEYENIERMNQKKFTDDDSNEVNIFIDWNDFVVVETIDFHEDEVQKVQVQQTEVQQQQQQPFIPPKLLQPPSQTSQQQKPANEKTPAFNIPPLKEPIKKVEHITEKIPQQKQPAPITQTSENITIRTDYKPKMGKAEQDKTKCSVCGNMIPTKDLNEHIQIELLDPKYREIKKDLEERNIWKNLVESQDIASNLQKLAKGRPDIFGQITQLELEGKQDQGPDNKIIWDGQLSGMTRTTANIAMMQNQQKKIIESNFQKPGTIEKPPTSQKPLIPPSIKQTIKLIDQGDKQGNIIEEGIQLFGEDQWLKNVAQSIKISIRVPDTSQDKEDVYNLKGQTIQIQVDPRTTISQIKYKISEAFQNLPPQKLKIKSSLFNDLKEEKTLAYYNTRDNDIFELILKDRK